ncbi:MAG: serine phosphatase RsbU (regulator of sigma subunit)/TPR repeat protein [Parvicellaceae bacterium]
MFRILKVVSFLFLVFTFCDAGSQVHSIDSVNQIYKENDHDTLRIKALISWDDLIYISNPELDNQLNLEIVRIAKNAVKRKKTFDPIELRFYQVALAKGYNILGINNDDLGNFTKALDLYYLGLRYAEEINDVGIVGGLFNNIGLIHERQDNFKEAFKLYRKSLEFEVKTGDLNGVATAYNNIGNVHLAYFEMDSNYRVDSALYYYHLSFKIADKIGDARKVGSTLENIGVAFEKNNMPDSALSYFQNAIVQLRSIDEWDGLSNALYNAGMIYIDREDVPRALDHCREAWLLANSHQAIFRKTLICNCLHRGFKLQHKYDSALFYMEQLHDLQSVIINDSNTREVAKKDLVYRHQKQLLQDSVENEIIKQTAATSLENSELKHSQTILVLVVALISLILVLALGVLIYSRLKIAKKQKKIIEIQKIEVENQRDLANHQRTEIEEQHREISDSISYAKRLQTAILPNLSDVHKYLYNSFVLFQPKDVVSGDFYWFGVVNNQVYIAVADCTGHGVPGAMVSVVCSNALNRALKEFNLIEPAEILNKTRELVISTFSESKDQVRDGMDIALIRLNFQDMEVTFAGANNPIWIVREDSWLSEAQLNAPRTVSINGKSLVEFRGDRQSIGLQDKMSDFNQNTYPIYIGDEIILTSDGFPDQFGGEKGKKLKHKRLKQQVLEIEGKALTLQHDELLNFFMEWKGDFEQVDDVCVIGIRVEPNR